MPDVPHVRHPAVRRRRVCLHNRLFVPLPAAACSRRSPARDVAAQFKENGDAKAPLSAPSPQPPAGTGTGKAVMKAVDGNEATANIAYGARLLPRRPEGSLCLSVSLVVRDRLLACQAAPSSLLPYRLQPRPVCCIPAPDFPCLPVCLPALSHSPPGGCCCVVLLQPSAT